MKVLFLCTHNRCRSILAEAIVNHLAAGILIARSAGSAPASEVHPLTLKYLTQHGYPTAGLHSKSWHELGDFEPDLVITVCDQAAQEACPLWLGPVTKAHIGLRDPSALTENRELAFKQCIHSIEQLCQRLIAIAKEPLQSQQTQQLIQQLAGTTS